MMTEFLIYDLKVAVLLAIFYMFYRLMLARETFHRVNRLVLLATAIASFVLPLCVITLHETVTMEMDMSLLATDVANDATAYEAASEPATPWWQIVLPTLFIIGMVATLAHTLMSLFRIIRMIRHSEQHPQDDGTTICVSANAKVAPFSWMHYIVMNRADYEAHDNAILTHERGHIRLRHSWDLILVDTLTSLQWFNPAMWMLRSDLRAIHEYEADAAVLSQGINAHQYQYLLITKAASIGGYSLANGISHSTLKNRINMMLHTQSPRQRYLKLLALVPIVAVALAVNAEKVTDVVYTNAEAPSEESLSNEMVATAEPQLAGPEAVVADDNEKFIAKGIVYDYNEDKPTPIVGAVVQVVGTKRGTVTDKEGRFKIEVSKGERLRVAYVGYESTILGVSKAFSDEGKDYIVGLLPEKEAEKENRTFDVVDEMPQFPGGPSQLFEFLARNVNYPTEAEKANIQGRVIVTFVVENDGSISGAKVVKSVDPSLDAEALRVVNAMPNWIPGKQNGKPTRVKYTVPVTFRLQGQDAHIGQYEGTVNYDGDAKNKPSEVVVVGYGSNEKETTAYKVGYAASKAGLGTEKIPLLYVDGKEFPFENIGKIDPKTIERMDVLKDKSAIEKYGEKAKDGVILITLKKK